jgi:hypothetical protein
MTPMTAVKPPETAPGADEFSGTGAIRNSLKALKRTNKMMTKMALSRPRRVAK